MTTIIKTVPWSFATRTTQLATNTTLGTATRHDFSAVTVKLEASRTVRAAQLKITARTANTVATDVDGWRIGIKVNSAAFVDVDTTTTQANTGDNETLVLRQDVTSALNAGLVAAVNQSIQVGVAFATGSASNVVNITCELFITYEISNAETTQYGVYEIPIQSHHTTVSSSYVEVGTTGGASNASANQIPQLTGSGGKLENLGSASIEQCRLRLYARDGDNTTTDQTLTVTVDGGVTNMVRATTEHALARRMPYYDNIDLIGEGNLNTSAVAALQVKHAAASQSYEHAGGVVVVVYSFSPASATRELHSVRLPMLNERDGDGGFIGPQSGSDDIELYTFTLNVQEPGTITIDRTGVVMYVNMTTNTSALNYATGQAERTYSIGTFGSNGQKIIVRRTDHDSSSWSLSRGVNRLYFNVRQSASDAPSGYAIINYYSDVPSGGVGTGNRTLLFPQVSYSEGTASYVSAPEVVPIIPESLWVMSGTWIERGFRQGAIQRVMSTGAERQSGEDGADGWYNRTAVSTNNGTTELVTSLTILPFTDATRCTSYSSAGMDIETTRRWRSIAGAAHGWSASHWLTYHALGFAVAGTVLIEGVAAANGTTVKIYAVDGSNIAEYVGSATVSGGHGSFTANVPDVTRSYFASYENGGDVGRSASGTAGTSTFDITIGGDGGIDYPTFPVLSTATTVEAIRDRIITVIESVTPTSLTGNGFKKYKNEGPGDFRDWVDSAPAAAFRRFQVRNLGLDEPPDVSNAGHEELRVTFEILIAYPQNARTGSQQALDRDDVMEEDWKKLNFQIGMLGKQNFSSPYADATPMGASKERETSAACDLMVIRETFIYKRATM